MDMNDIPDDMHLAEVANFDFGKEAKKYYPIAAAQARETQSGAIHSDPIPVSAAPNNAEGHEHPRGLRSGTLAVSDRGANGLPTPGSFEGLENREEVIAKPLTNKEAEIARRMAIAQTWLDVPMGEEKFLLEELILDYRARLEHWEPLTRDTYEHDLERESKEEQERLFGKRDI